MDTKRPEPACAAGYSDSFMMGKGKKDVFLSAKSGMKKAEGEDESVSSFQSSFVSRWCQIKSM